MMKPHTKIEKLQTIENKAVSRLGKLPRLLLKETADKETVLAEMDFQRNIIDVCHLCLCYW